MTTARPAHGTFTIERHYKALPQKVYADWADPVLKAKWFVGPQGWTLVTRSLDFKVGGGELLHGRFGDRDTVYSARYHLIVPDTQFVYVYDMHVGTQHHSVSLATVEFRPQAGGTLQRFTEQVVFVDGTEATAGTASREHGTAAHFDRLAARIFDER